MMNVKEISVAELKEILKNHDEGKLNNNVCLILYSHRCPHCMNPEFKRACEMAAKQIYEEKLTSEMCRIDCDAYHEDARMAECLERLKVKAYPTILLLSYSMDTYPIVSRFNEARTTGNIVRFIKSAIPMQKKREGKHDLQVDQRRSAKDTGTTTHTGSQSDSEFGLMARRLYSEHLMKQLGNQSNQQMKEISRQMMDMNDPGQIARQILAVIHERKDERQTQSIIVKTMNDAGKYQTQLKDELEKIKTVPLRGDQTTSVKKGEAKWELNDIVVQELGYKQMDDVLDNHATYKDTKTHKGNILYVSLSDILKGIDNRIIQAVEVDAKTSDRQVDENKAIVFYIYENALDDDGRLQIGENVYSLPESHAIQIRFHPDGEIDTIKAKTDRAPANYLRDFERMCGYHSKDGRKVAGALTFKGLVVPKPKLGDYVFMVRVFEDTEDLE